MDKIHIYIYTIYQGIKDELREISYIEWLFIIFKCKIAKLLH